LATVDGMDVGGIASKEDAAVAILGDKGSGDPLLD
jgi:hypothetical protein